ncbi:hypothetical protein [Mucilaginibacter sp.]
MPEIDYLVDKIKIIKHPGCQRHYAKIIMHLTSHNAHYSIKDRLEYLDLEPVVEQCFDWMIDPKVLIAVKVFAAEALFNLSYSYPWIAEELINQLYFLLNNGSAAIQSFGRKLFIALKAT